MYIYVCVGGGRITIKCGGAREYARRKKEERKEEGGRYRARDRYKKKTNEGINKKQKKEER
jgi:hypothetical protein